MFDVARCSYASLPAFVSLWVLCVSADRAPAPQGCRKQAPGSLLPSPPRQPHSCLPVQALLQRGNPPGSAPHLPRTQELDPAFVLQAPRQHCSGCFVSSPPQVLIQDCCFSHRNMDYLGILWLYVTLSISFNGDMKIGDSYPVPDAFPCIIFLAF